MNRLFALSATSAQLTQMRSAVWILICVTAISFLISGVLTFLRIRSKKNGASGGLIMNLLTWFSYGVSVLVLVLTVFCGIRSADVAQSLHNPTTLPSTGGSEPSTQPSATVTDPTDEVTVPTDPTVPPTEPIPEDPILNAGMTDSSDPKNWNVKWSIIENGEIVDSYHRPEGIFFGNPDKEDYFDLPGIATFRGNNYRNGAAYGFVNVTKYQFTTIQTQKTGSHKGKYGNWTGSGWTGQPLIVKWDSKILSHMNLLPEKAGAQELVEVIYATMDGKIYFYDLFDGELTREPIEIGMSFKGSGSLDPRGYPLLYVGSGDINEDGTKPRMYIISLIDGSILYQGGNNDKFAERSWCAFDSAPLVSKDTDTLIWPGENGVLYTMKLNSHYDPEAGTVSIAPESAVRTVYTTKLDTKLGFESSAIIVQHYIYIADNGGMFFCVDLNTMELVWARNVQDDTNATPVFEWGDDGQGYLYTATSMEFNEGKVLIEKLNASTGEQVWLKEFDDVFFNSGVSGGVLSSPILGKKGTQLEGLVIYTIARTPGYSSGLLVALNTENGEIVWEKSLNNYSWSSPVAIYSEDGTAYIILCDSAGNMKMLSPSDGSELAKINLGSNIEASPAIYENMIVVGTRGRQVYFIRID